MRLFRAPQIYLRGVFCSARCGGRSGRSSMPNASDHLAETPLLSLPKSPRLRGRRKIDGSIHLCAKTRHVRSKYVEYTDVIGGVTVDIYRAHEPGNVGVVLRITSTGDVGFIAHGEVIDGGIKLHLADEQAERSLLDALHQAIGELRVIDLLRV